MTAPRILIITTTHDVTSDYVVLALRKRQLPFFRINTDTFPLVSRFTFESNKSSSSLLWESAEGRCSLDQIKAIYFRRQRLPALPHDMDDGTKEFCAREISWYWNGTLQSLNNVEWMNHPHAVAAAEGKLHQLTVARRIGLQIPDTLTTNDPKAVKSFFTKHNESVVAKAVRSGYITYPTKQGTIFTSIVSPADLEDLSGLRFAPVTFQEHVQKECDVRVTVVGSRVFATAIHSQDESSARTDWRATSTDTLPHSAYALPVELAAQCVELTRILGLTFGAIDLIRTPDGRHVFLEINPSGQWAWLQEKTGDQIADAIATWLEAAAR